MLLKDTELSEDKCNLMCYYSLRIVVPSVILITLKKKSLNHRLYSFESAKIYTDIAFLITQQHEKINILRK